MTVQINSNYLEKYAEDYASIVCEQYFASRSYMTGQDIVKLTNSTQVNFLVIKSLFELWQGELAKLKSSPFFDYRDISVHEALTQFMNVLSKRIKVEKAHMQPLVKIAVAEAIKLATDPVAFYQAELAKAPASKFNDYLKENKKYYKWHPEVVTFLIDKAGFGNDEGAYMRAISANYQVIKENLQSVNLLLATLGDVKAFDLDAYRTEVQNEPKSSEEGDSSDTSNHSFFDEVADTNDSPIVKDQMKAYEDTLKKPEPVIEPIISVAVENGSSKLDPGMLKARFASESYKNMKGISGELSENLAINQRFMFTKELFDGNADLLKHALKSLDHCSSFEEAIGLVNSRYVSELSWNIQEEPVEEFLQLVYRKFEA